MSDKNTTLSSGTNNFDVVVIGAGSGGLTAAVGFAKVGKKVLLVEREHMGGECTNTGCVPSKALLHHAKVFHAAKKFGGDTKHSETFRREAFTYVRQVIDEILKHETPEIFAEMGIKVVEGEAEFISRCAIKVANTTYSYKKAVIATGSSPRLIDIKGLPAETILTNQNLFSLKTIPERLLIIGGGPIGLEMAQAFAMLGSQVTIVERGEELARLEDPIIRQIVHDNFAALGIRIETNAEIAEVIDHTAHFTRINQDETFTTEFDQILIAIGRTPNLPRGLDDAGIQTDHQGICVDGQYRGSVSDFET